MKLGNEGESTVGETIGIVDSPGVISTIASSLGGVSGATVTSKALIEASETEGPVSGCASQ